MNGFTNENATMWSAIYYYFYYHNKQTKENLLSIVIVIHFILICKSIRIRYKTLNGEVHLSLKETSTNALPILHSNAVVQNRRELCSMHRYVYTATGDMGIAVYILVNIFL